MVHINCLKLVPACLSQGGCPDPEGSVTGHNIAPFVGITIEGSGNRVTVGNQSTPGFIEGREDPKLDNTAVIKSFQYNFSSGYRCKIVIYDEQGGSFFQFMEDIVGCWDDLKPGSVNMEVIFGWTKTGCNGEDVSPEISKKAFFLINSVTADYNDGRIQFEIEGIDLLSKAFEGRDNRVIGKDHTPRTTLREAVRKLWAEGPAPNIKEVEFAKVGTGKGQIDPVEFDKILGAGGAKGNWHVNGLDKIAATEAWLRCYASERIKGWRLITDQSEEGNPRLIIMEDPQLICDEKLTDRCIKTYVVNGGNCSRVVEFNPKIKWDFQSNVQRRTGDAQEIQGGKIAKAKGLSNENRNCEEPDGAGIARMTTESCGIRDNYPLKEQVQRAKNAAAVNDIANPFYHDSIEADLVIQGDPTLGHPLDVFGRYIKLIVMNPYHISASGSGCGDWLLKPWPCNQVLTNKNWMVRSVDHYIQEGLFTTTWKVMLAQTGTVLNRGTPMGGSGEFTKECKPTGAPPGAF